MMTGPWSMTASAALALPDGDQRHQADERCPSDEDVRVQDRHAEQRAGDVEKRQDRVVEQQHAEHAQRDEALSPGFIAHRASLPRLSGRGRTTVTLHGASATTCADTPANQRCAALRDAPINIWSTSFMLA